MRSKDTEKMQRIINFVDTKYFEENYVPTMQEIADEMGMTKSNVSGYVKEMAERGMLVINNRWRGICTNKIQKTLGSICRLPIIGTIACGTPMLAEENIESYVTISSSLLGAGDYFILRASGNSMLKADIEDGDLVLVKQQQEALPGQIVVALIDDSTTLKRYYLDEERQQVCLHPENDEMEDMYFDYIEVQGVVKKILKDAE